MKSSQILQSGISKSAQDFEEVKSQKKLKDFICPCGRSYGSYPALFSHIRTKHDGKAPGKITKPTPQRKRGRPYKMEHNLIKNNNAQQIVSQHFQSYMQQEIKKQNLLYPFKQMITKNQNILMHQLYNNPNNPYSDHYANQNIINSKYQSHQYTNNLNNLKQDFVRYMIQKTRSEKSFINQLNQKQKYQYFLNLYQNQTNNLNPLINQNNQKQFLKRKINQMNHHQNINNLEYISRYNQINYNDTAYINPQFNNFLINQNNQIYYQQLQKLQKLQSQNNPQIINQLHSIQQQQTSNEISLNHQNKLEKKIIIKLRKQKQQKMQQISIGIMNFLQPILNQMVNDQSQYISSYNLQENQQNKQNNLKNQNQKKNQIFQEEIKERQPQINQKIKKKKISDILQNQYLNKIFKWMISPPIQKKYQKRKQEDFIQSNFRYAIINFLEYVKSFLQTCQYEQVLLSMIIFCDHILEKTKSFKDQPQPLGYQMIIYINQFIDIYMPKIIQYMPEIKGHFIFADYENKLTKLFLWFTKWMSMEQYYSNKYFRQMIKDNLQQECKKAYDYQKNYSIYINSAFQQNKKELNLQNQIQLKIEQPYIHINQQFNKNNDNIENQLNSQNINQDSQQNPPPNNQSSQQSNSSQNQNSLSQLIQKQQKK